MGCTVPESFANAGVTGPFEIVRQATEELYEQLCSQEGSVVAEYVLMQAHRRRVRVKMNARELYAFSRLREDEHAQWEVRAMAHELICQARSVMPLTLALACGKDAFAHMKAHRVTLSDVFPV